MAFQMDYRNSDSLATGHLPNFSTKENCSMQHDYTEDEIYAIVTYVTLSAVSLPLSIALICISCKRPEFRKAHNFMILNLLFMETMLLFCFAFGQSYHVYRRACEQAGCAVLGTLVYASGLGSFFNYALISIQRYYSMFRAEVVEEVFKRRNVFAMIAGTWAIGFIFQIPFLAVDAIGFEELKMCGSILNGYPWRTGYMLIEANICTITCYGICVYCNVAISRRLKLHKEQMNRNARMNSNVVAEFESVQQMILVQIVLPIIVQMPVTLWKTAGSGDYPWISRVTMTVYLIYPAASPYVIIFCLKPYRDAMKRLLGLRTRGALGRWISTIERDSNSAKGSRDLRKSSSEKNIQSSNGLLRSNLETTKAISFESVSGIIALERMPIANEQYLCA